MPIARWLVLGISTVAVVSLSACGGPSETPRLAPLTPRNVDRLAPEQAAAIEALADSANSEAPVAGGGHAHHEAAVPASTVLLNDDERARFAEQWTAAVEAASNLDTPAEAGAAGYTRAAAQGSGVGVHWVNWLLIDAPFDPARPSMLLFDERDGRAQLVGFSYWIRASAPEGFAATMTCGIATPTSAS